MKVQFNGPEADVTVFDRTFIAGEATDISDLSERVQTKLANNPTFSVVGKAKAATPATPAGT